MSRALGDYRMKFNPEKDKCEQIIIAKPDIYVHERSIEKDEYLVLACDGIWDVIENDELKQYIDYSLSIINDLENICVDILDMCRFKVNIYFFLLLTKLINYKQISRDNLSIILVTFPSVLQINQEEIIKDNNLNESLEKRTLGN